MSNGNMSTGVKIILGLIMLAALNFDLYNKQRGTGWTHQDLR